MQVYVGGNGSAPWFELGKRGDYRWHTQYGSYLANVCWKPRAQPGITAAYFIIFVFIGCFIILSLFIGAVTGGMCDAMSAAEMVNY